MALVAPMLVTGLAVGCLVMGYAEDYVPSIGKVFSMMPGAMQLKVGDKKEKPAPPPPNNNNNNNQQNRPAFGNNNNNQQQNQNRPPFGNNQQQQNQNKPLFGGPNQQNNNNKPANNNQPNRPAFGGPNQPQQNQNQNRPAPAPFAGPKPPGGPPAPAAAAPPPPRNAFGKPPNADLEPRRNSSGRDSELGRNSLPPRPAAGPNARARPPLDDFGDDDLFSKMEPVKA